MSRPPRRQVPSARSVSLSLCLPAAVFPHQSIPSYLPVILRSLSFFCVPDAICLCGRASIGSLRRTPRSFVRVPRRSFDPSRACPVSLCSVFLFSVIIRRCLRIPTTLSASLLRIKPRNTHKHLSIPKRFYKIISLPSRNVSFAIFPTIRDKI